MREARKATRRLTSQMMCRWVMERLHRGRETPLLLQTKSVLVVTTENTAAATAAGPVLRPFKVMVKAPTGLSAAAAVMVIVLAATTEVEVRAGAEDAPAALAMGAADVSNQPVGKLNVIVAPIGTAVVVVNVTPILHPRKQLLQGQLTKEKQQG